MSWNFTGDKPIFGQIVDRITLEIISGKYEAGERLAAVRDLAIEAGVNPNTMQRALAALEETGLVYTKRGDGRFVTEDKSCIAAALETYVSERCKSFAQTLKAVGLPDEVILDAVGKVLATSKGE